MPSIFYPTTDTILPFLFYEAITVLQEKTQNIELGEVISQAYKICHSRGPSSSQVEMIAARIMREAETAKKKVEEQSGPLKSDRPTEAKRKAYGGFLLDWIGNLDAFEICMFVADFKLVEAKRLYCEEDKESVLKACELKGTFTWEKARAAHEAVLFGMGGGYKGHVQEEGVKEINLSEMEGPLPTAELRKFGLMKPH